MTLVDLHGSNTPRLISDRGLSPGNIHHTRIKLIDFGSACFESHTVGSPRESALIIAVSAEILAFQLDL